MENTIWTVFNIEWLPPPSGKKTTSVDCSYWNPLWVDYTWSHYIEIRRENQLFISLYWHTSLSAMGTHYSAEGIDNYNGVNGGIGRILQCGYH